MSETGPDVVNELRWALAEADAVPAAAGLLERVVGAATAARPAGRPVEEPDHLSGVETFRRSTAQMEAVVGASLGALDRPARGSLTVAEVVAHLVGVEEAFHEVLRGGSVDGADHLGMTAAAMVRLAGADGLDLLAEWAAAVRTTLALVADRRPTEPVSFYGITLPLDDLLVVRAFELWIHGEDATRAVGAPVVEPDDERVARLVGAAISLLPLGLQLSGRIRPGRTVRLVLTGRGGGTWTVPLDGTAARRAAALGGEDCRVVVDRVAFCRVIGDRLGLDTSGAMVAGDHALAVDLFAGASALALD